MRIVRKGKGNNNHTQRATKTMQEDKERQPEQRRTKGQKAGKEMKRKAKGERQKDKKSGKHATSP